MENLIKESNNDVGLTAPELTHRTVATTRLRMQYLAAKITRHGGRTEVHFGSQYQDRDRFD